MIVSEQLRMRKQYNDELPELYNQQILQISYM